MSIIFLLKIEFVTDTLFGNGNLCHKTEVFVIWYLAFHILLLTYCCYTSVKTYLMCLSLQTFKYNQNHGVA